MPNSQNGNELEPATPVVVAVTLVYTLIREDVQWFLVRLDTDMLAVAALSIADGRARWTLVEDEFLGDGIKLDARGVPERYETIECPICASHVDVTFALPQTLLSIFALCPKCGYQINDVEQHVVDVKVADDDGGGTSERT